MGALVSGRRRLLACGLAVGWTALLLWGAGAARADFLTNDDLIVSGGNSSAACLGIDCVNGESFGFDSLRLKENNNRICFDDTSVSPFPAQKWELVANSSASGGPNAFGIDDVAGCGGNGDPPWPFLLEAGAPNNAFFLDSAAGDVGLGTANPILDLHVNTTDTPGMRLEQNAGGGFSAQTWDVAGNEANFFVRDVTSGSRLPFRIRPGAPTSSIDIAADGDVGIGTASPDSPLHVERSNGTANLLVEETNATEAFRDLLELRNNGITGIALNNTARNNLWRMMSGNVPLIFDSPFSAGNEFTLLRNGNLTITGTLSQGSDRNRKEAIREADPERLLDKLAKLPISTWQYKADRKEARHLGPMAQDFHGLFGLGNSPKVIAPADMAGVAMAAIQALIGEAEERDAELQAIRAENRSLSDRLAALEAKVTASGG